MMLQNASIAAVFLSLVSCSADVQSQNYGGVSDGGSYAAPRISWDQQLFVQEYWTDGTPWYMVFNNRDKDVELRLSAWELLINPDRYKEIMKFPGSWKVAKKSITHFNASVLLNIPCVHRSLCSVRFRTADEIAVGSVSAPNGAPNGDAKVVSIYSELNAGPGYPNHDGVFWLEMDKKIEEGTEFEVRLRFNSAPANPQIKLPKKVSERSGLLGLAVLDARSATATITQTEEEFLIETADPAEDRKIHEVLLRLEAPRTDHDRLVFLPVSYWSIPGVRGGVGSIGLEIKNVD